MYIGINCIKEKSRSKSIFLNSSEDIAKIVLLSISFITCVSKKKMKRYSIREKKVFEDRHVRSKLPVTTWLLKNVSRVWIYCGALESYQAEPIKRHLSSGRPGVHTAGGPATFSLSSLACEVDRRFFRDADDVPPWKLRASRDQSTLRR